MVSANSQLSDEAMAMSAIVDQWEVQYARFVHFPPPPAAANCTNLHPSLVHLSTVQRRIRRGGVWISTSPSVPFNSSAAGTAGDHASLKFIADCSADVVLLNLSVRCKVLEEHRISKLNFTWPHVSCVSGFPARGARSVFVSYKDSLGQVQKFALRFSTSFEAERFINVLKEIMDNRYGLQGAKSDSELSSQSEFVPSIELPYRPEEDRRNTTSADASTYQGSESLSYEVDAQIALEAIEEREAEETLSDFPPSFTSFLKNYCPASAKVQSSVPEEVDLKTQVVRYLEDTSFQDMLSKVEKIIGEMGDGVVL